MFFEDAKSNAIVLLLTNRPKKMYKITNTK